MKKSYSIPHSIQALLLAGFCTTAYAQVSWVDTTITTSVTDEDIVISGSNTVANSITISALEKDVRVSMLADATLTGTDVTIDVVAGVSTSGNKHHVAISLSDKTLHVTNSVTLKIGTGNSLLLYGGELSLEDDSILTN